MTEQVYGGISAVHYSDDHSHIERVRVHEISEDKIAKNGLIVGPLKRGRVLTKNEVADRIESGKKFMTLVKEDGNWVTGQPVRKYTLTFLRSNPTPMAKPQPKDDLEELPEF
jgi:hypothetical protein